MSDNMPVKNKLNGEQLLSELLDTYGSENFHIKNSYGNFIFDMVIGSTPEYILMVMKYYECYRKRFLDENLKDGENFNEDNQDLMTALEKKLYNYLRYTAGMKNVDMLNPLNFNYEGIEVKNGRFIDPGVDAYVRWSVIPSLLQSKPLFKRPLREYEIMCALAVACNISFEYIVAAMGKIIINLQFPQKAPVLSE